MVFESSPVALIYACRSTKIYCRPGCPAGRRTKPENRVYFQSREEARANGYRACKVCKPDAPHGVSERFFWRPYRSPVGDYLLVSSPLGVVCLSSEAKAQAFLAHWGEGGVEQPGRGGGYTEALAQELDAYFKGVLRRFSVPLDLRGTPFQRRVWQALCQIPYGETCSYGEIARALGQPKATRAVGQAIGKNPVAIVVPCHRVIGADGSLTGYGGGLDRKQALLQLETAGVGHLEQK